MAIQDFTAGQVLTAVQMDNLQANDYNQTVSTKTASYTLVAADKGTRVVMNSASATTITVNTSLFSAGDTLILQNIGAGVCTVTAGTATVSTAGSLAIAQNGSGTLYFTSAGVSIFYPSAGVTTTPGLVRIAGATFSAVSSITVDNIFSATYTSYKVIFNYFTSSTGSVTAQFRVGGVAAATNYNAQDFTASSTTLSGSRSTGNTSFLFAPEVNGSFYSLAEWSLVGVALAQPTNMISAMNRNNGSYANPTAIIFNYVHTTATAYDGIAWTAASGTMTGSYQIYGYAIS